MFQSEFKITVNDTLGKTSVIENRNTSSKQLLILAHGAGADMRHHFMEALSAALLKCGIATWRFNFLYKENGKWRPDRKPVAVATIRAVVGHALNQSILPLSLAGKSFGGRMMSHFLAEYPDAQIAKMIYYGFPLHPAGKPSTDRASHLKEINHPMYFLQGDRDALAKLDLINEVVAKLPKATLEILQGADHSFKFLKKYGLDSEAALALLAQKTELFINS